LAGGGVGGPDLAGGGVGTRDSAGGGVSVSAKGGVDAPGSAACDVGALAAGGVGARDLAGGGVAKGGCAGASTLTSVGAVSAAAGFASPSRGTSGNSFRSHFTNPFSKASKTGHVVSGVTLCVLARARVSGVMVLHEQSDIWSDGAISN
jgi:hypothetical protein